MAVEELITPYFELNGVDITSHVRAVSFPMTFGENEVNAFGSKWEKKTPGMGSYSLTLTFNMDYDTGAIEEQLWNLLGTKTTWLARKDTAAVGPSNPEWTGTVLINAHTPFDTEVGGVTQPQLSFPGDGQPSRATS